MRSPQATGLSGVVAGDPESTNPKAPSSLPPPSGLISGKNRFNPGPESLVPPPQTRRAVTNTANEPSADKSIDLPPVIALESRSQRSVEEVLQEAARRKAASRRWAAIGFTGFVVAALVALYLLLNPPSRATAPATTLASGIAPDKAEPSKKSLEQPSQVVAPDPDHSKKVEASSSEPNSKSADTEAVAAETVEPERPIAWGQTKSVGRRELEKLWAQLHPYLFRLAVKKAGNSRTVSGVLVDSRGWLVTSLSAVEGASSIEVFPAPANPLGDPSAESIKDEIRGVLAVDRARDLVLLQVNRRLVNVVSGLQPTDKLLVPGRWMIQAAAIGPERFGWLTECRVQASEPDKFPPELQQTIARRKLDLAPYWPQHGLPLASGMGGGLFTEDGRLAGVNTGYGPGSGQFFAESKLVLELVGKAKEPAAPLSSLSQVQGSSQHGNSAEGDQRAADAAGRSPFAAGHEAEPIAKRLAESGAACEAFGWMPADDATQTAALESGLLAFREAQELLRARQLFPKDAELLKKQVDYWSGRIKANLLSLAPDSIAEFNQQAWGSTQGDAPQSLILFVRVVLQPGTSPRVAGADTATLQLLGMEQYLIATVGAEAVPLLPDSEWLVVVTVDPKEETLVSPEPDRQASARRSTGLKEIAEVKSIGFRLQEPDAEKAEPEGEGGK